MGASKGTHEKVLELLGDIKNKKILDCGAGRGTLTKELIERKGDIYAVDIDPKRFNLNIPFKKADFNDKIPFKKSYFDKVVSIEVIEHLEKSSNFIQELNRILKSGGELIITTPNIHNIKSKIQFFFKSEFHWFQEKEFGRKGSGHIHPFYWKELVFLLERYGFTINEITSNRYSKYTFYYAEKENLIKKVTYTLFNLLSDIAYRIISIFCFPKKRDLLFGDILIIKAIKNN